MGFNDGDANGFARAQTYFANADYNSGFADGHAQGLSTGYNNGYADGDADGFSSYNFV